MLFNSEVALISFCFKIQHKEYTDTKLELNGSSVLDSYK